jgi:hypothetical protein
MSKTPTQNDVWFVGMKSPRADRRVHNARINRGLNSLLFYFVGYGIMIKNGAAGKQEGTMPKPKSYTPEELEIGCNKYFNSITLTKPVFEKVIVGFEDEEKKKPIFDDVQVVNNEGEQVYTTCWYSKPTILGLCEHLKIDRKTLLNYERNDEYFHTVKMAKERIEQFLENELFREQGQVTGVIFNLKNNFGWKDKQETEHSGEINIPQIVIKRANTQE